MKKNIVILLLCFACVTTVNAQSDHANQIANKIAQRMTDSLDLTSQQKNALRDVNKNLDDQKKAAWQQYGRASVTPYIQKIENKRDSLYKLVLPPGKYILYKQKKHILVNNN